MSFTLGFDSSTQSCSATLIDCHSNKVAGELSVNFGEELPQYNAPSGFIPNGKNGEVHSNPLMWLDALDLLITKMVKEGWKLDEVTSISGSGQQHGSVYLNSNFETALSKLTKEQSLAEQLASSLTRETSPIWMDKSTRIECDEISKSVGGDSEVCSSTGSIMIERFTGSQIRKFAKCCEDDYKNTSYIHLVSSFFASIFAGKSAPIDTGDGAGMNLMNLANQDWDDTLLAATADNLKEKLPEVSSCQTQVGTISNYFVEKFGFNSECKIFPWSGDNPCSLVGMGATKPGKLIISLGTSYTLFAAMENPLTDPQGFGHVFGNPMGGYMSLICFMNGSLAREKVRESKEVDWSNFGSDYLEQTPVGNDGKIMLPFYEPEITPLMNLNEIVTNGWSLDEEEAATQIRACIEGQMLNMCIHSQWIGETPTEILVTGGGSKSDQICQIIADIFGANVVRPENDGSASLGAAIMAAVGSGDCKLEELYPALCEGGNQKVIKPKKEAQSVYQKLLIEFTTLLKTVES